MISYKFILNSLVRLNEKIDKLEQDISLLFRYIKGLNNLSFREVKEDNIVLLSSLPPKLIKTWLAISSIKKGSADDISKITKRARAVESSYLNQLVQLKLLNKNKFLNKRKGGQKIIFEIIS